MKDQIIAWIQGPRNYYEGVAIYQNHGHNLILKQRFAKAKNETTESLLFTELCKLAGLTETQATSLPRKAKIKPSTVIVEPSVEYADDTLIMLMKKIGINTSDFDSENIPVSIDNADETTKTAFSGAKAIYTQLPETTRRVIKIREEFPFLKANDCPIEIKLLTHEMFNEYDKYREAHLKLTEAPENTTIEELFTNAQSVVESYLSNRAIWDELENYKEHKILLGKHPILESYNKTKEFKELSDIDLTNRVNNVRGYVTKAKNTITEGEANKDNKKIEAGKERLTKWSSELELLIAELDLRKK